MQVVESEDDLAGVEERRVGVEAPGVAQICKQFTAADVLEEHIEEVLVVIRPKPAVEYTDRPDVLDDFQPSRIYAHKIIILHTTVTKI